MVMSASSFSGFPADARILGLDIGSISVDVVLLDGLGTPLYSRYVRHHGQPDKVLCAELEALERTHAGIAAAVTGTGADRVGRLLGACAVNEVIAQVAAASFRCPQARSVIDIGGQDSKYIQLEPAGEGDGLRLKDFSVSSMCASGTGSFLDQQATRLGLDIETEFGEAALRSRAPARIAGRCSVFAKSDMIHLQQKGTPVEDIVAGLCHALARSFKANVVGVKALELPVALVGGVAANAGVVKALRSVLHLEEDGLFVPEDFALSGAFGAALFLLGGQGEAVPYKGLAAFREGLRQRVPMKTLVPLQPVSVPPPGCRRASDEGPKVSAGFMPPLRPAGRRRTERERAVCRGVPRRASRRAVLRPPHPASRRLPRSRRTTATRSGAACACRWSAVPGCSSASTSVPSPPISCSWMKTVRSWRSTTS